MGHPSNRAGRARTGIDNGCLAVSSGQAARYCLVSGDTIANWITVGRLPAQRTAGGQYRIRLSDLRCFMGSHGMRTDILDAELGHTQFCWEFWSECGGSRSPDVAATCLDCPVYRGRAQVCRELRPLLPGGTLRALSCADCAYLTEYMESVGAKEWTTCCKTRISRISR